MRATVEETPTEYQEGVYRIVFGSGRVGYAPCLGGNDWLIPNKENVCSLNPSSLSDLTLTRIEAPKAPPLKLNNHPKKPGFYWVFTEEGANVAELVVPGLWIVPGAEGYQASDSTIPAAFVRIEDDAEPAACGLL